MMKIKEVEGMKKLSMALIVSAVFFYGLVVFFLPQTNATGKEMGKTDTEPKTLNIAMMTSTVVEEPWNTVWVQAMNRIKQEKPHGLDIDYTYIENVQSPDSERILNSFAKTGKYQIIWAHAACPEVIEKLHKKYPEILWVMGSTGFHPVGENAYLVGVRVHEPAYLLGMLAGMMTESNVVSVVASFPYPVVNSPVNAFFDGALAVNPKVKPVMTYIESWFDPTKAKEAALAQIAAGSDFVYAERFGPFEAAREKGVLAFGHFMDQYELAPDVVVSSTEAYWDPIIRYLINEWWNHVTKGVPYNAPMETVVFGMKDGGAGIAPFYSFEDKIPAEVKDKVKQASKSIKDGKLIVPYRPEKFESK